MGIIARRMADLGSLLGEMLEECPASAKELGPEDKQVYVCLELAEDMPKLCLCARDSRQESEEPWEESDGCELIEAKLWQPLLSS